MLDKTQEFLVVSEQESRDLAVKIAAHIKPGDILTFKGDLGAGKTFLCREIIKSICGQDTKVVSPTFNLLQTYEHDEYSIYHFDLYRLEHISEIYELGIEEAFAGHVCLIEWPELAQPILPKDTIQIDIHIVDHNKRKILVKI